MVYDIFIYYIENVNFMQTFISKIRKKNIQSFVKKVSIRCWSEDIILHYGSGTVLKRKRNENKICLQGHFVQITNTFSKYVWYFMS